MILAINSTKETAVNLAYFMERFSGKNFPVFTTYSGEEKISIRYGNASGNPKIDTLWNSKDFIGFCTHKKLFSKILCDNGINTPVYHSVPENIVNFPILVRSSLSSTGGRGIFICHSKDDLEKIWKDGYFWTEFVNMDFELRVHVLGGKIERIFKKVWKHDEPEPKFPIRNMKNGYHYSLRKVEKYPKLDQIINKLTELFGENCFYGLDIGYEKGRGYFVIEANSAPNLNSKTVELYAKFLVEKLEENKSVNV